MGGKLYIDTREKPPEAVEVITMLMGRDKVERRTLPEGDYAAEGGDWVVERKRISDLVSSMVKHYKVGGGNVLFDQLERCLDKYRRVFLLVEGRPVEVAGGSFSESVVSGRYRKVPYLSHIGALLHIQDMGVRVVWTAGIQETAMFLFYLLQGGGNDKSRSK